MKKIYSGSIALTKLKSVVKKMKGKNGNLIDVIIIPIEDNYLTMVGGDKVYLDVNLIVKEEKDKYGNDGFISQRIPSKIYKDATEEQKENFKKLPILGNIKNFSSPENDSSGLIKDQLKPEDDTPLPF